MQQQPQYQQQQDDAASDVSSVGHQSGGSLRHSSSGSSTSSRAGSADNSREPRVHHIPIVVEGKAQTAPTVGVPPPQQQQQHSRFAPTTAANFQNSPNGHSSGYASDAAAGPYSSSPTIGANLGAHHNLGRRSASPMAARNSPRNQSPDPSRIPIVIQEVPVTKVEQNGYSSSPSHGPHVTRIPVNSDPIAMPAPPAPTPTQQSSPRSESPMPPNSMAQIAAVKAEVDGLERQVQQFSGESKDKQYRYLDEMLTREMIKLDNIDTDGHAEIRAARKDVIRAIEKCAALLESRSSQTAAVGSETKQQQAAGDSDAQEQQVPMYHEGQPQQEAPAERLNQPMSNIQLGAETAV